MTAQTAAQTTRTANRQPSTSITTSTSSAGSASAKRRRALELAERAGLGPWAVRFVSLEVGKDGQPSRVDVDAPSGSVPWLAHRVVVDLRAWTASCDCVAATFGRPCQHAGAALRYGGCVVIAYAEAASEYAASVRYGPRGMA